MPVMRRDLSSHSAPPLENKVGDRLQELRRPFDPIERIACGAMDYFKLSVAGFHPVKRRISCLARARILSRRLAEILSRRCHIQKIVSDLKQQPEIVCVV